MKTILISINLFMFVILNTNAQTINSNQTIPSRNPTSNFNFIETNTIYKSAAISLKISPILTEKEIKDNRRKKNNRIFRNTFKTIGPIFLALGVGTLTGTILGTKHIAKNINDNNRNLKMGFASSFGSIGTLALLGGGTTCTLLFTFLLNQH